MVLVDADDGAGLAEALVHAVRPPAVAVLQVLDNLQLEVHVHLVAHLRRGGETRGGECRYDDLHSKYSLSILG